MHDGGKVEEGRRDCWVEGAKGGGIGKRREEQGRGAAAAVGRSFG